MVFAGLDRSGFPADRERVQPWKQMGVLRFDRGDQTGWVPVMVARSKIYDCGEGSAGGY